jgi:HEAT repeat protein
MKATHRVALGLLLLAVGCSRVPPYQGRTVEQLQQMLDDPDSTVQASGALGLSQHGPEALPAAARLAELLHSPAGLVRQNAALALARIGPEGDAVAALTEALDDTDWPVRRQAALALGEYGPAAASAIPGLTRRARDPEPLVQKAALQALERVRVPKKPGPS